jgi:hypothetical protein
MRSIFIAFLFFYSLGSANELRPFLASPGSTRGIIGLVVDTRYIEFGLAHGSTFSYTSYGSMTIPFSFSASKSFGSVNHRVYAVGSYSSAVSKSYASKNEFVFMPFQAFGFGIGYTRLFEKIGFYAEVGTAWSKEYSSELVKTDLKMHYFLPSVGIFYRL